jgi:hypothetical protein|tara:strand:+ start:21 stop:245 length:225 start_codon:yes stop_codon:yes gene_type:complete
MSLKTLKTKEVKVRSYGILSVWLRKLTSVLQKLPAMLGNGKKTISKEKKELILKFRYWKTEKHLLKPYIFKLKT